MQKQKFWKISGLTRIWTLVSQFEVSYAYPITMETMSWNNSKILSQSIHKNCWPGVLKFEFLIIFDSKIAKNFYPDMGNIQKEIVIKFPV